MLAQECFNDHCDSKVREKVLQLAISFQKDKYEEYTRPTRTQRTGVFLMAVILVKERIHSAKFIEAAILQEALLCLNIDKRISEDFSKSIIESSEKFLIDSKK